MAIVVRIAIGGGGTFTGISVILSSFAIGGGFFSGFARRGIRR
jgi:hypothetical protein